MKRLAALLLSACTAPDGFASAFFPFAKATYGFDGRQPADHVGGAPLRGAGVSARPIQSPPVSRGGTRPVAALVAAAFRGGAAAACGGGGSSTSTAGSTAVGTTSTQKEGGATATAGGASKKAGSGGIRGSRAPPPKPRKPASSPPKHHTDSGGGRSNFEVKGGDNSVQEFGGEADEIRTATGRHRPAQLPRRPRRGQLGRGLLLHVEDHRRIVRETRLAIQTVPRTRAAPRSSES